ncbi:MAG: hypothetical protein LBF37_03915 [Rickettsiales bacterium]|nr:hypothetical protein [Rickettsiales bacterium]
MQQKSNQFKNATGKTKHVSLDILFRKIETLNSKWLHIQGKQLKAKTPESLLDLQTDEFKIVMELWTKADEYTTAVANPRGDVTTLVDGVYKIMHAAAARIKDLGSIRADHLRARLNQQMDPSQELENRVVLNRILNDSLKVQWTAKPQDKKQISEEMARNYTRMQALVRQIDKTKPDTEILATITNMDCEACIGAALRGWVQKGK